MSELYRNVILAASDAMQTEGHSPRLAETLRRLEVFLSDTTDQTPDPANSAIVRISAMGEVLTLDERAAELLGLAPGDQLATLPDLRHRDPTFLRLTTTEGEPLDLIAMTLPDGAGILLHEVRTPGRTSTLATLADTFSLNPSEVDVLRLILTAASADQIATKLGRTVGTVRQQTKALLAKMGARSQIQAITRIAAMEATKDRLRITRDRLDMPVRLQERVRTPTGDVTVIRFGAPGGTPVLMCHGALYGAATTAEALRLAAAMNLDIAMPVRPGYGTSAWHGPAEAVRAMNDICLATMQHLGWRRAVVLAHDIGVRFALDLATRHPTRVAGIVAAPATPPMVGWAQTTDMPRRHRVNAWAAQRMPALMDQIVKFGVSHIQRKGIGVTADLVFADSVFDRDAFAAPIHADLLAESFALMAAQQAAGFRHDMRLTNEDWSCTALDTACPVHFLHGDRSGTVSATALATVAQRMPDAVLERVAEAGHTLPLTDPALMLRCVLRMAARQGL